MSGPQNMKLHPQGNIPMTFPPLTHSEHRGDVKLFVYFSIYFSIRSAVCLEQRLMTGGEKDAEHELCTKVLAL